MSKQKYKYFILLLDIFFLSISLYIIATLKMFATEFKVKDYTNFDLLGFILIFVSSIVVFFRTQNLYKLNYIYSKSHQIISVVKSFFYSTLTMVFILLIYSPRFLYEYRDEIIGSYLISLIVIISYRIVLLRKIFLKRKSEMMPANNVIIVGSSKIAKNVALKAIINNPIEINLIGFVDDNIEKDTKILSMFNVLGRIDDLDNITAKFRVDEIIIAVENVTYEQILEIIDKCRRVKIPIRIYSEIFNVINENLPVEKYAEIPLVDIRPLKNPRLFIFYKRVVDLLSASLILIVLTPFFLIIGLVIKIESKGPVIFKQKRIGLKGKEFYFLKFRTMRGKEEEDVERKKKMIEFIKNDNNANNCNFNKVININRITKVGEFLRKYSIDELPQLFNVILGDMSLVGPRPCLPYEYENYEEWQKKRFDVLPGCTGVWQVYGRGKVNFNDSIILDLFYVNNMTPWLDTILILKTLPVMITGKGGG